MIDRDKLTEARDEAEYRLEQGSQISPSHYDPVLAQTIVAADVLLDFPTDAMVEAAVYGFWDGELSKRPAPDDLRRGRAALNAVRDLIFKAST